MVKLRAKNSHHDSKDSRRAHTVLFGACWTWNPQHLATESSERGVQSADPASWVDVDRMVLEAAAGTKDRPSIDWAVEGFFSRTRKVLEEMGGQYILKNSQVQI